MQRRMRSDTKASDFFMTEDRVEVCLYGEGETRLVAEKVLPQLQALLQQGIEFSRGCLRMPYECELHRVSIFECNAMGEEVVLHCAYDSEDCGAMPGDLSIDFGFVCGGARYSQWKWPPKCVRVSVRVT